MPSCVSVRFRPPSRWRRPLRWGGNLALGLFGLLMVWVLWAGPRAWGEARRKQLTMTFFDAVTVEPVQLGEALETLPEPGPGFPQDRQAASRLLQAHPLVAAVFPSPAQEVWVREGDVLRLETGTDRSVRWLAWAREADRRKESGRYDPPLGEAEPPTFLLMGPRWTYLIRWEPGSPEAEAFLRRALGPHPKVRAGLARITDRTAPGPLAAQPPAFHPPHLQTTIQSPEAAWTVVWTGTVLGPRWEAIFQPWPDQARVWEREVRKREWLARAVGILGLGLLAVGLAVRKRHRRQEAARLAALTHSLKTPLAIHKLRCDTLRMGHWPPARQAEELLRLGQEVDDLTRLIERGLLAGPAGLGLDSFGPEWMEDLAEALRPALEAEGRPLELDLQGAGLAHLPTLQTALQTLLENACAHGRGRVRLASRPLGGRLRITVEDEGPGLAAEDLQRLGRPLARPGGHGLGLSLLVQMARQEGWGLAFSSETDQGLCAMLDVPLSSR